MNNIKSKYPKTYEIYEKWFNHEYFELLQEIDRAYSCAMSEGFMKWNTKPVFPFNFLFGTYLKFIAEFNVFIPRITDKDFHVHYNLNEIWIIYYSDFFKEEPENEIDRVIIIQNKAVDKAFSIIEAYIS